MKKGSMLGSITVLLGGLAVSDYALAQSSESSDEAIVVAPSIITSYTKTVIGNGDRGVYDVHTLTKEVSYADLDLSKPADADRFVQRIKDTAKRSCDELKAKFPDPPNAEVTLDQECVKNATAQAMLIATPLIDHAQVAVVTPVAPPAPMAETTPPPAPMAEAEATPEPAPAIEAEATAVPPKQDRN
jgi:UrcA family protein